MWRRAGFVGLGIAACAYLAATRWAISPLDERMTLHIGARVARGEVPYRDVSEALLPGSFYVAALAFRLFGVFAWSLRGATVVVNLATLILLYRLARAFLGTRTSLGVTSLAAVLCFGYYHYTQSLYNWLTLLGTVAAALALVAYVRRPTALRLTAVGLCLGATLFTKQNAGIVLLAAVCAFLGFEATLGRRFGWARGSVVRAAGRVGAVVALALVPLALFGGYLWTVGSGPRAMIRESFVEMLRFGQSHGAFAFDLLAPFRGGDPWAAFQAILFLAVAGAVAAAFVKFAWSLARAREADRGEAAVLFVLMAAAMNLYPRVDLTHLTLVVPLAALAGALALGRAGRTFRGAVVVGATALALAALATQGLIAAARTDDPGGVYRGTRMLPEEAESLRTLREEVDRRLPAGTTFLALPFEMHLYEYCGRRNPSRIFGVSLFMEGSGVDGELAEVLGREEVAMVLFDTSGRMGPDPADFARAFPRTWAAILGGFAEVRAVGGYRVYVRGGA